MLGLYQNKQQLGIHDLQFLSFVSFKMNIEIGGCLQLYRCNQAWGIHSIYLVGGVCFFCEKKWTAGRRRGRTCSLASGRHFSKARRVGRVALITRKAEISNKQGMVKRPERPKMLRSEGGVAQQRRWARSWVADELCLIDLGAPALLGPVGTVSQPQLARASLRAHGAIAAAAHSNVYTFLAR